jgi:L-amino acid N-acyltransferase YncA
MNIDIQEGELKDLEVLAEINSSDDVEREESRLKALEQLPDYINKHNLIVAKSGEEIFGLLYFDRHFFAENYRWFIVQITIREDVRRKGIGEALWKHAFALAKENGINKVFADVKEDNVPSTNLVNKLGGIDVGYIELGGGPRKFYRFNL